MQILLRLFVIDVKRALLSFRFWGTILIIGAVMGISTYNGIGAIDVVNLLSNGVEGSGTFLLTLCILPTIPYAASYASDHNAKAIGTWSIRSGIIPYAVSKFIISVVLGMLAYLLGMMLYAAVASINLALYVDLSSDSSYTQLLIDGKPFMYLTCYLLHFALSAALFSGFAFCVSTLIPNAFVAMVTPVILYFLYLRICNFIPLPAAYTAVNLVQSICSANSPGETLLTKAVPVFIILLVLCIFSTVQIRRRSMHE